MEKLGIDYKLLIAQLINFGLFFFVFKRYIAKPFGTLIEDERQKEHQREKALIDIKKKEEEIDLKKKTILTEAEKQAEERVENAKKAAEVIRTEIIENANRDAQEIRNKGKKLIEEERNKLQKQAQGKISELSLFLVNQALKELLTDDMRKKITQAILKNSPKKMQLYEN